MKIFVIDLCKNKLIRPLIGVFLILTIMLAVTVGVVTKGLTESLNLVAADTVPYEKIVIIDAGHGGEDPGAVGPGEIYEKDLNLAIALEIGKALEEKGYIAVYTRTDDRLLYTEEQNIKGIRKISDLKNRCAFAEQYPESVFVSIHMNSFGDGKYSGLQVYYKENSDNSRNLADKIQTKIITEVQPNNKRAIKAGSDMYVLNNISNDAVLIECGFLTNNEECKKLSEKEYQKQLSFSIVCGIIEYIESKD